jgi:hypothetical protein
VPGLCRGPFLRSFLFLFFLFSATTTFLSSALDLRVATRASIVIRSKVIAFFFFSASVCFAMTLCACLSSVNIRRSILWRASATVIIPPFYISLFPTLARTLRRFLAASESLSSVAAWASAYTRVKTPLIKEYKYSFTSSGIHKANNIRRSSEAW